MTLRSSRLVSAIFIVTLLTMMFCTPMGFFSPLGGTYASGPPVKGLDNFVEDFATTTYRDGVTTASGWGTGAISNPRVSVITQLDFFSTADPVMDVDVQGRKAYFTMKTSGPDSLQIVDLSNPEQITLMDTRNAAGDLISIEVVGDIAYVGTGAAGGTWMAAYNVSNPYSIPFPEWDSNIGSDAITDLTVQGHHLYAALYGVFGAFRIYDVEDPANIIQVFDQTWNNLTAIDVKGQLSYMAHGEWGFNVRNVSNPYAPVSVGSVDTPGNASAVLVEGTLAYVADWESGVQIIDVSTPDTPTIVGTFDTTGQAQNLALQGKTLFVADGDGGLVCLDVSNPASPQYVSSIGTAYTYDVALYGGVVVVGTASGLYTFQVGIGLADLPLVGVFDAGYEVWDVRVCGDVAYVAAGPNGFLTIDVSDVTNPVLLDQYNATADHYRKLDVQGHLAYVIDSSVSGGELRIFDVSDPSNIQSVWVGVGTNLMDVFAFGEVVFYTYATGFGALNVSDPYSPNIMWTRSTGTNMTACWVQGYHLYMVSRVTSGVGFFIYDITDLNAPNSIYTWGGVSTNQYDIFVEGDSAYIVDAAGTAYSEHWNVMNPYNPYYSDYVNSLSGTPMGVWAFGPYMVTANYTGGVCLWNTSDINDMQYLAGYAEANRSVQITVAGDYIYVANRTSLVILRLFHSAGNTYITSSLAQSTQVDATAQPIRKATLTRTATLPSGTSIDFEMSADGGTHWETVTVGVEHTFAFPGSDLRWLAAFASSFNHHTPSLSQVTIDYEYDDPLPPFNPLLLIGIAAAIILVIVVLVVFLFLRQRSRGPK
ncbi:MAG: LVIVD repeat-containing protein [Candidatus Hodarchaeota archaeon]